MAIPAYTHRYDTMPRSPRRRSSFQFIGKALQSTKYIGNGYIYLELEIKDQDIIGICSGPCYPRIHTMGLSVRGPRDIRHRSSLLFSTSSLHLFAVSVKSLEISLLSLHNSYGYIHICIIIPILILSAARVFRLDASTVI